MDTPYFGSIELSEEEAKQVIGWGVRQAASFSLAHKFRILLCCPFGCPWLLSQERYSLELVAPSCCESEPSWVSPQSPSLSWSEHLPPGFSRLSFSIGACWACCKKATIEMECQRKVTEAEIQGFRQWGKLWDCSQLVSQIFPAATLAAVNASRSQIHNHYIDYFQSSTTMIPWIARCAVNNCTQMIMVGSLIPVNKIQCSVAYTSRCSQLPRGEDWIYCKTEALSEDEQWICALHLSGCQKYSSIALRELYTQWDWV